MIQLKFPIRHNYQGLVANYVRRSHLEKEIMDGLYKISNKDCPINFPIVVLHGIGGVGKTTLARKICQMATKKRYWIFGKHFGGNCLWINAEKEELIINDFVNLFGIRDVNKQSVIATLKKFYSQEFAIRRCLIVFDNV